MKIFWYLSSVLTILFILISNPKASNLVSFSNESQFFSYTKSTQTNIQLITIFFAIIFVLITVILTSHSII